MSETNLKNLRILFSASEFNNHCAKLNEKSKRKRLLVDFHDSLSLKLQSAHDINCWLSVVYNWFNSKSFWNALYKCIMPECTAKFKCNIPNKPLANDDVILTINCIGACNHDKISKKSRCTKQLRKEVGLNLLSNGVSCVIDENIIYNNAMEVEDNFREGF